MTRAIEIGDTVEVKSLTYLGKLVGYRGVVTEKEGEYLVVQFPAIGVKVKLLPKEVFFIAEEMGN